MKSNVSVFFFCYSCLWCHSLLCVFNGTLSPVMGVGTDGALLGWAEFWWAQSEPWGSFWREIKDPLSFLGHGGHRLTRPPARSLWGPSQFRAGIDFNPGLAPLVGSVKARNENLDSRARRAWVRILPLSNMGAWERNFFILKPVSSSVNKGMETGSLLS